MKGKDFFLYIYFYKIMYFKNCFNLFLGQINALVTFVIIVGHLCQCVEAGAKINCNQSVHGTDTHSRTWNFPQRGPFTKLLLTPSLLSGSSTYGAFFWKCLLGWEHIVLNIVHFGKIFFFESNLTFKFLFVVKW